VFENVEFTYSKVALRTMEFSIGNALALTLAIAAIPSLHLFLLLRVALFDLNSVLLQSQALSPSVQIGFVARIFGVRRSNGVLK